MKQKENETTPTSDDSLSIGKAIKHYAPLIIALLIALCGCNFSKIAKSDSGQELLTSASAFVLSHSNYCFLLIVCLLALQLILNFLRFQKESNLLGREISEVKSTQKNQMQKITDKCENISSQLDEVERSLAVDSVNNLSAAKDHRHEIYDCLKDLHMMQMVNRIQYQNAHRNLYGCIASVCKDVDTRLHALLVKYNEPEKHR